MWLHILWYIFTDLLKNYDIRILRVGRNTSSCATLKMEVWRFSEVSVNKNGYNIRKQEDFNLQI